MHSPLPLPVTLLTAYFVASFVEDHLRHHAAALLEK